MRATRRDKKKATAAFASAAVAHDASLWLDADDVAHLQGTTLASWPSRFGNSPTQGVVAQQPLVAKNKRAVVFDGLDDVMSVDAAVNGVEQATVLWFCDNQATSGTVITLTTSWWDSNGFNAGIGSSNVVTGIGAASLSQRVSRNGDAIAQARIGCAQAMNRTPNPGVVELIDNNGRVTTPYFNQGNPTGSFANATSYIGSRDGVIPKLAGGICSILVLRTLLSVSQMHSLIMQFRRGWRF